MCFRFDALTDLGALVRTEFLCISVLRKIECCRSQQFKAHFGAQMGHWADGMVQWVAGAVLWVAGDDHWVGHWADHGAAGVVPWVGHLTHGEDRWSGLWVALEYKG